MSTPAGEAKRARREEAREKAARLQAEAAAAERRRRTLMAALAVLVVAALAIGITFAVKSGSKGNDATGANPSFGTQGVVSLPAPAGSTAPAANAVTVRTALDYMCPACKSFEAQTDSWQQQQVKAGKIKREFVPVAILDRFSNGTRFSTRASSAAYCVATADPSKLHDFTKAMYAVQPAENSNGLTNDQILTVAKQVIPNNATMNDCITSEKYGNYATKITDQASKDGLQGTPTVWVNGKILAFTDTGGTFVQQLQKAIAAAQK